MTIKIFTLDNGKGLTLAVGCHPYHFGKGLTLAVLGATRSMLAWAYLRLFWVTPVRK